MRHWDDYRVEQIIGNLLRVGVILSAAIAACGGAVYLARHAYEAAEHGVFRGEPPQWSTLSGIFSPATLASGRGIIMVGLLVLILTPVARVVFSLAAFALERDWLYVGITAVVLSVLVFSLMSA
jgi:uncharacterized membrane protein